MTRRERIADWISGGALSDARKDRDIWECCFEEAYAELSKASTLLDRIAAQETPNANATVKRMARIARGEER